MQLAGKIAVVTGAARGTGATTARRFVEEGATVVVADLRDDQGRATAEGLGERASFHHLDVTDDASWAELVRDVVAAHGRVDVLVNNAAILHMGSIANTPTDTFRRVQEVNTTGCYAGIRAIAPVMAANGGGAIVNVASIDGLIGMNGVSAYVASKWGLRGLTKSAALELGRDGIRVNAVCPAGGNPEMYGPWGAGLMAMADDTAHYLANRAIPRPATTEEIADVIVFLASDLSRMVTGVDIPVDGGETAGSYLPGFNQL